MKKKIFRIAGICLLSIACIGFTACGDDEPQSPGTEDNGGNTEKPDDNPGEEPGEEPGDNPELPPATEASIIGNYTGETNYFGGGSTTYIIIDGVETTTSTPDAVGPGEIFMAIKENGEIMMRVANMDFYYTYEVSDNCLILKSTQYDSVNAIYKYEVSESEITLTKVNGTTIPVRPEYTETHSAISYTTHSVWSVTQNTLTLSRI